MKRSSPNASAKSSTSWARAAVWPLEGVRIVDATTAEPAQMRHEKSQMLAFQSVDHAIPSTQAVRKSVEQNYRRWSAEPCSSYSIWAKRVRANGMNYLWASKEQVRVLRYYFAAFGRKASGLREAPAAAAINYTQLFQRGISNRSPCGNASISSEIHPCAEISQRPKHLEKSWWQGFDLVPGNPL